MRSIMDIDQEWKEIIETQVQWVEKRMLPCSERMFKGPVGKIKFLQLIIDSRKIKRNETVKLRCLGTYFGQTIVEATGWPWKVVEDEYGIDLAIQAPGSDALIYPISMISQRIEADERFDVMKLFDSLVP